MESCGECHPFLVATNGWHPSDRSGSGTEARPGQRMANRLRQTLDGRRDVNIAPDEDDFLMRVSIAQAEGDLPRAAALLASIHRVGSDFGILAMQTYQAILERRPEQVIDRLRRLRQPLIQHSILLKVNCGCG